MAHHVRTDINAGNSAELDGEIALPPFPLSRAVIRIISYTQPGVNEKVENLWMVTKFRTDYSPPRGAGQGQLN
jgi:hypothetical protein